MPLIFSFHKLIRFYKFLLPFLIACTATAIIFIVWDVIFTAHNIWSFNPKYLIGLYCFNLPLEEVGFFFCIPYACSFTYFCIKKFLAPVKSHNTIYYITFAFSIFAFLFAFFHKNQYYTSVTLFLLGTTFMLLCVKKVNFLYHFFISFSIILIPFFISNGLLTGTGLTEPVVLYNNNYNLGIRILTIPIEDIFYGMLLQLLNITGFEILVVKLKK
jgi:lycopene cyclase domain-containing protein